MTKGVKIPKRTEDATTTDPIEPIDEHAPQLHSVPAKGLLLHFFVNLSIVADVEGQLSELDFGRIHHRVMFFAAHAPGITVSELLAALRVTHQNIRIVMKQLIDRGYLIVRIDTKDRRQKRLFVSSRGRRLVESLLRTQLLRIKNAFASVDPAAVDAFIKVHELLIDPSDRDWMERMWDPNGTAVDITS
jgi:DNA-binding MarR family transcriptional regulator